MKNVSLSRYRDSACLTIRPLLFVSLIEPCPIIAQVSHTISPARADSMCGARPGT